VSAFDPVVKNLNSPFDKSIQYCEDKYSCAHGADLLVLVTEWAAFKNPDFTVLASSMRELHIVDGRNIWKKTEVERFGFTYVGIGR
jgi:UDPglucose 6-dehydrogenase